MAGVLYRISGNFFALLALRAGGRVLLFAIRALDFDSLVLLFALLAELRQVRLFAETTPGCLCSAHPRYVSVLETTMALIGLGGERF